jgi:hypothetical protein
MRQPSASLPGFKLIDANAMGIPFLRRTRIPVVSVEALARFFGHQAGTGVDSIVESITDVPHGFSSRASLVMPPFQADDPTGNADDLRGRE